MYPFVFSSCDFVQIKLTVGQNTYFFKTAGSLTKKQIKSVSIPSLSYDSPKLSSIDPSYVYITLIDTDGNLIHNNTPASYFSAATLDQPEINKVIDWERSYIKIMDVPEAFDLNKLHFFMNVFTGSCSQDNFSKKENYYSVTIHNPNPDGTGYFVMPFDRILNALRGYKISGILLNTVTSYVVGFVNLYPLDSDRFFNRMDITNFLFFASKAMYPDTEDPEILRFYDRRSIRKYIVPTKFDFEKSNIEVYTGVESFNLTFIYE